MVELVHGPDSLAQGQVTGQHDVLPVQGEDQRALHGPRPDPGNEGELRDDLLIRQAAQHGQVQPSVGHPLREIAQRGHLPAGQARVAQFRGVAAKQFLRRGQVAAEQRLNSRQDVRVDATDSCWPVTWNTSAPYRSIAGSCSIHPRGSKSGRSSMSRASTGSAWRRWERASRSRAAWPRQSPSPSPYRAARVHGTLSSYIASDVRARGRPWGWARSGAGTTLRGEEPVAVPLFGRVIAAVIGGVLVLTVWGSVIGALIVSRPVASRWTRAADKSVNVLFRMINEHLDDYRRRDRCSPRRPRRSCSRSCSSGWAPRLSGSRCCSGRPRRAAWRAPSPRPGPRCSRWASKCHPAQRQRLWSSPAPATGLVIITLQIAYLPTLYAAFNRRETEVALLNARAGVPSWGPELLARTHYGLGSGTSTIDTMPGLYAQWERWAADVAESHTTYLPLVRFRSPQPYSSWVTALLAVLDSAALFLSLSPKSAPVVPARLCLRGGFQCFTRIARAMGIDVPTEAEPDAGITLTYEEFLGAVAQMKKVDFPIERDPADACRTSSAGGSSTSGPPMRSPSPWTRCRPCGRARRAPGRAHRTVPAAAGTDGEISQTERAAPASGAPESRPATGNAEDARRI